MQKDIQTIGRRKTAVARVFLKKSSKPSITVGDRDTQISEYFDNTLQIKEACLPLELLGVKGEFAIHATVKGSGKSAQAGALKLAIARALVDYEKTIAGGQATTTDADGEEVITNPWKAKLKKASYLTVDSRKVERKKPGLKGARKAEQYSKR